MKHLNIYALLIALLVVPEISIGQKGNSSIYSLDFGVSNTWILNQNIYGNPEMAYTQKLGFSCVASHRKFTNKYGYSFGLGYRNMGQNYMGEMADIETQRSIELQYLQMPFMGMVRLGGNNQSTWFSFGPQVMILLSAEQEFKRIGGKELPNPDMLDQGNSNIINRFNPIDMMLAFELVHQFTSGSTKKATSIKDGNVMWSLSLNTAIGLTDINRKAYQISNLHEEYASSHNFYVGIHLGFLFNSKTKIFFHL
ncbi:MAG: hypothetical protein WCI92_00890 [Bacteroidota bacterium]